MQCAQRGSFKVFHHQQRCIKDGRFRCMMVSGTDVGYCSWLSAPSSFCVRLFFFVFPSILSFRPFFSSIHTRNGFFTENLSPGIHRNNTTTVVSVSCCRRTVGWSFPYTMIAYHHTDTIHLHYNNILVRLPSWQYACCSTTALLLNQVKWSVVINYYILPVLTFIHKAGQYLTSICILQLAVITKMEMCWFIS